jgi:DNA modification methylase
MNTEFAFATHRVEIRAVSTLTPYSGNARTHSRKQIRQIADSIRRFGFTNPVLISDEGEIIAGHGRVLAAKELGMTKVPALRLSHLTAAERRAYILADNKLALNAGWDTELLAIELQALIDLDFEVSLTGFTAAEVDFFLDEASERSSEEVSPVDIVPSSPLAPVTRQSDLWLLGRHRLLCGDARNAADYQFLLRGERVDLVFTDPPYNVRIDGNVSGLGSIKHREFAMASGEMSQKAFTDFLTQTLSNAAATCRDGAIAFVCMDWRHMKELLEAGNKSFTELKNLCVWNKTNGGMGTFYRSKHELVFVFKAGTAPHTNNFSLGDGGRYRTNVWDYPGVSSLSRDRHQLQEMHPTVKPTALVADAIRDCSKRNEIVLDSFGGSGPTLIAAETCGRRARLIEYDAAYCDTIIARWERLTGKRATLAATGEPFENVADQRAPMAASLNREVGGLL